MIEIIFPPTSLEHSPDQEACACCFCDANSKGAGSYTSSIKV